MKGYLFKDFYLNYGTLIVVIATQLACSAVCIVFGLLANEKEFLNFVCTIFSFLVFVLAQFSSQMIFKNDERPSWFSFSASTPQTFKGQVGSKYIFMFTVNVIVLLFGFATNAICSAISSESLELWGIVFFFAAYTILNAIKLPFIFRFGSDVGARGDVTIIGIIVLTALVYILFGDISFVNLDDPFGSIIEFLNNDGLEKTIIVILCASLPIYFVSYLISLKVSKKGIENFE